MTETISSFEGESGSGANINLNVPMPGTHTGRRTLVIEDISGDVWSEEAYNAGTSWAEEVGVEEDDDGGWVIEAQTIPGFLGRFDQTSPSIAKGLDEDILHAVEVELLHDALSRKVQDGHLKNWIVDSPIFKPDVPRPPTDKWPTGSDVAAQRQWYINEFQRSFMSLERGIAYVPVRKWAGGYTRQPVYLTSTKPQVLKKGNSDSTASQPRLFLVQVYGISSFLGDYGLGRTVKTFTLLPGEETTIYMRTWRSTTTTETLGRSIIDSYDETTGDTFAETLYDETTDQSTQSEEENWYAEGEVKQGWGTGSAKVSGGGGGEYASSSEEFAKSTDETVSSHCYEASSHRETSISSSSEYTEVVETEEVIERTIKNINVKRVLNFVFRELNQEYIVKTHLKDVRVAFCNGRAGSWREVPLSGLRRLLEEVIDPAKGDIDQLARDILSSIATVFDRDDKPVNTLEQVVSQDCGDRWYIDDPERDDDCAFEAPRADGTLFYRFKRGKREDNYALGQEGEEHKVPGVLMRESKIVMRTDGVVVEALMGTSDAVDSFAAGLQIASLKEKELANAREALAQTIIRDGDAAKAELFEQIFCPCKGDEGETA